jgi:DNA repair protein RecN (Recombination protein N)
MTALFLVLYLFLVWYNIPMLQELIIRNFGLIDKITVEPSSGLNVLTGMTGAGKSILVDALRCALGERFNSSFVRDAKVPSVIEAVFRPDGAFLKSCPEIEEYLEGEETLIIRRTFMSDGKTKNTLNGMNVPLMRLKEIGDRLVDFHGPHDHQLLFRETSHIAMLDRLSGIDRDKKKYLSEYAGYKSVLDELDSTRSLASSRERDIDLLTHQIKELEQVPLSDEAYQGIVRDDSMAHNSEKLLECVKDLAALLDEDGSGITEKISRMFGRMEYVAGIDAGMEPLLAELSTMQEAAGTLSLELNSYLEKLDIDPETASETARKMDSYINILKKYGPGLDDARAFLAEAKRKYDTLIDLDHNTAELEKKLKASRKKVSEAASILTSRRKKSAASLKKTIEKELEELGISKVRFECRVTETDLTAEGADRVVFYISPNVGEELKPLAEIVSSGEAARVMLALKKALINVDPVPVLIFDEIDAQIGGRLGTVTGKKLKELALGRQVLLITHLPQIASFGDKHFKALKRVKDGRTETELAVLEGESRVKELARMMSGEKETQIAVTHAQAMLQDAAGT